MAKIEALDLVAAIESGHDSVMKAIRIRLRNIQNVRSIWTNGNIKVKAKKKIIIILKSIV